jgi:hypothetical protein
MVVVLFWMINTDHHGQKVAAKASKDEKVKFSHLTSFFLCCVLCSASE